MNVENPKSTGSINHFAFICIANTEPRRLLEFIYSTRKYKKRGGHPAFFGIEENRKTAPLLWNTSDYASVAWLNPYSDKWNSVKGTCGTMLLDFTIASVFPAYCLHIWLSEMGFMIFRKVSHYQARIHHAQLFTFPKEMAEAGAKLAYDYYSFDNHPPMSEE
ncbi:hypothetical protein ACTXT7_012854 [Hymenolepis weldensis]